MPITTTFVSLGDLLAEGLMREAAGVVGGRLAYLDCKPELLGYYRDQDYDPLFYDEGRGLYKLEGPSCLDVLRLIDEANLDAGRRFCVIDDSQIPYECRSWSALSSFRWMMLTEMIVPTTKGMALGAMDARDVAGVIFRSPMIGLLTGPRGSKSSARAYATSRIVVGCVERQQKQPAYLLGWACGECDTWRGHPGDGRRKPCRKSVTQSKQLGQPALFCPTGWPGGTSTLSAILQSGRLAWKTLNIVR